MLSALVNNREFSLDDGTLCRLVGYDGWGSPNIKRYSSQGPQQDGDTDEGQRLQPRLGKLVFQLETIALTDMYERRQTFLDIFNPDASITLKWVMDYGTRYIDVRYYGDMSLPWDVKDWAAQRVGITLKASDPTFYDPDRVIVNWVGATGTAFAIPWVVPTFVGGSSFAQAQVIQYEGTWIEYPEIQIVGPVTDPVITNETTGEVLDFTGNTINAGDTWTIDLRYGYKTVQDQSVVNKIDKLTDDSDLATWHLARKLAGDPYRENSILVGGTGVSTATRVYLRYYNRYLGR